MMIDKIKELGPEYESLVQSHGRADLDSRLAALGVEEEEQLDRFHRFVSEGVNAFADYIAQNYGVEGDALARLRVLALRCYLGDGVERAPRASLPVVITDLKTAITEAESAAVGGAKQRVKELRERFTQVTLASATAPSEQQRAVFRNEANRLEMEIAKWAPRAVPLSERFKSLHVAEQRREAERQRLLADWPAMEGREKGEALRRVVERVELFWTRTFHAPVAKPTRRRMTARTGRYSYALERERVQWHFTACDFDSSW